MRRRAERIAAAQGRIPDVSKIDVGGTESIVDVCIDIIVTYNSVHHGTASDPIVYRRWTAHKVFSTANGIVAAITTKAK